MALMHQNPVTHGVGWFFFVAWGILELVFLFFMFCATVLREGMMFYMYDPEMGVCCASCKVYLFVHCVSNISCDAFWLVRFFNDFQGSEV